MKRLVIASLVLCGIGPTAHAASNTGNISASLEITGECEVIVAPIGATTANFTATSPVVLQTSAGYGGSFDAFPAALTAPTTTAGDHDNVAVLCSAGGGADHTVDFATTATMSGSGANTLAWTPKLGGVGFIANAAQTTITEDTDAATLSTYKVTGEVTAQNVADAIPDTYTATVSVTVTY